MRNQMSTEDVAPANSSKHSPIEALPDRFVAKREMYDQQLREAMAARGSSGFAPQFVITSLSRWRPGQVVRVAFKGGDSDLHKKIADTASTWCDFGNLSLEFTDARGDFYTWSSSDVTYKADIRISFDQTGYYSVVGADSIHVAAPNEESMNLEGFDAFLPSDWAATVLHEFGHALGFEHEHQHPSEGCDAEFRWEDDPGYIPTKDSDNCWYIVDAQGRQPGIYTVLGGCPNNWSRSKVDFNLRKLPSSRAFLTGPFDRDSIMKYHFDTWMFRSGSSSPCFSLQNQVLSAQDKHGFGEAYPFRADDVAQVRQAQVSITRSLIGHFSSKSGIFALLQNKASSFGANLPAPTPVQEAERLVAGTFAIPTSQGVAAVPRFHAHLLRPDTEPMMDLSNSSGIGFNAVDGGNYGLPTPPWFLFKGCPTDTWYFAPAMGKLGVKPDGSPAFSLVVKVRNNSDGSRTWVGGTLCFLINVAQNLPTPEVVAKWDEMVKANHNLPRGTSFQYLPLPLMQGRMIVTGLEGKVVPGGQPLVDVPVGTASAIAFAINLTGEAAEDYYKQFTSRSVIPPAVAINCAFKYQMVLPTCSIKMSGSKEKTYRYFADSFKARASYWGLVDANFERSTVRADLRSNGGFQIDVIGTPPAGIDLAKLTAAMTDKFLLQEVGQWIDPKPEPVDAKAPGGFFGGASYKMKSMNFSASDSFSATINVSDVSLETHNIAFNFESAMAELDPAKHAVLIEDDRKLDLKIVIGDCPLVQQSTGVASYTRNEQPVRVQVPDLDGKGGITAGIIQWSAGLEPKPTSAQMETAFIYQSPYPSFVLKRTVPISDAGAVLAIFPDNYVQRTEVVFIFDGTSANNIALCQWQWTPPAGSRSLPVSRIIRVSPDANSLNLPSTQIVFPLNEDDVINGGKLELKVKGLRGEWAGKETPTINLTLGQGGVAVDWSGALKI